MDYDQNSKARMEKVINDRLRLASDEIKKSLLSLYEHCAISNHDKNLCEGIFSDFIDKLNNEIWYLLNNYLTDSSQALLGGCKHRINQAVLECQSEINQISIDNQLKTSFEKLITVIEEALNTITGIINKWHKEIADVKSDVTALKTRQAINDHHLLLRELFNGIRCCIVSNIDRVQLPKNYIEHLYDDTISMERLSMERPFLSYLVKKISNQYGLTEIELIHYLQKKRNCNSNFHLDQEIKDFAIRHSISTDYDIEKFIKEENLFINIDENERKKLQKLFEEICRGYNKSSDSTQQPSFQLNQKTRVLYSDGKFYKATLRRFDGKTNKWLVHFNDNYPPEWTISSRIFSMDDQFL